MKFGFDWPSDSEENLFENVDGRRTKDGLDKLTFRFIWCTFKTSLTFKCLIEHLADWLIFPILDHWILIYENK